VCPWAKTQKKSKKNGNHADARYVHKFSVPGIQFRAVPVSLIAFSGHKTLMYTLEVGSTIFTSLRRDRGLDCHVILVVESIYTLRCLRSKMEIEEW